MTTFDVPAVPLILDSLLSRQPVSIGLTFRKALRDVAGQVREPLELIRTSFARAGGDADDAMARRAALLWPVGAMVSAFRTPREFPAREELFYFLIALETMAVYSVHLLRDLIQIVDKLSPNTNDHDERRGAGKVFGMDELRRLVDVALAMKPVEVLEAVLNASWVERSGLPYAASRVEVERDDKSITWAAGHDVFTAGKDGLVWRRYGATWLGDGHLCGARPRLHYLDKAVLRSSVDNLISTKAAWESPLPSGMGVEDAVVNLSRTQ